MSTSKVTTTTRYSADLTGPDGGPTGIMIRRETNHRVVDTAGRRRWQEESRLNMREGPREILAELTMSEAVQLLTSLADSIGFMAAQHPECTMTEGAQDGER